LNAEPAEFGCEFILFALNILEFFKINIQIIQLVIKNLNENLIG
jgi:hypothetical protein